MKHLAVIIAFLATQVSAQINLNTGLTACYPLDGAGSEGVNNLTAILNGVSPGLNRFGTAGAAMDFAGSTGSYLELPDNPLLKPANAISFSCWIKTPVMDDQYILCTKNSMSSYFEAYDLCIDPSLHFMARKGGPLGMNMVVSTVSVSLNTWYHLVTTIDNYHVKLYVNGVLEASTVSTFTGFDYVSGKKVFIGVSNEPSYDAPFTGTMDNLRFYNRTLTATEILTLYNQDPACAEVIPTALSSLEESSGVKFFPSPVHDKLHIQSDSDVQMEFTITDVIGRTVISGVVDSKINTELDLTHVSSGIYLLKTQVNGVEQIKKIVKE